MIEKNKLYLTLISISIFTILILNTIAGQAENPNITIKINGDGVATVYITTQISIGVTGVDLPVKPIESSIEVTASTATEWVLMGDTLYIASSANTTATISYIANVTIVNGVLQLNITKPVVVRLVISPNIILLSIPNETLFYESTANETVIVFKGPATIQYTIAVPTTQTTTTAITTIPPTPTPTPTPLPTTTSVLTTSLPTTSTSATTLAKTSTPQTYQSTTTSSTIISPSYTSYTSATSIATTATTYTTYSSYTSAIGTSSLGTSSATPAQPVSMSTILIIIIVLVVVAILVILLVRR